jgi:hypothetical protein
MNTFGVCKLWNIDDDTKIDTQFFVCDLIEFNVNQSQNDWEKKTAQHVNKKKQLKQRGN